MCSKKSSRVSANMLVTLYGGSATLSPRRSPSQILTRAHLRYVATRSGSRNIRPSATHGREVFLVGHAPRMTAAQATTPRHPGARRSSSLALCSCCTRACVPRGCQLCSSLSFYSSRRPLWAKPRMTTAHLAGPAGSRGGQAARAAWHSSTVGAPEAGAPKI